MTRPNLILFYGFGLKIYALNLIGVILQATSALCHDRPSPVITSVTSGVRGLSHASTMTSPSFDFGNPGKMEPVMLWHHH